MLSPELALELRTTRPRASAELRGRVLEVAGLEQPTGAPRFSLPPLRRVALVAVPAALAVAVGGALLHGVTHNGTPTRSAARPLQGQNSAGAVRTQKGPARLNNLQALSPFAGRLEQYGASLRLQVKDLGALSDTTKRAMHFARLVGGYVAYVRYSSPGKGGSASLVVRVPIDRVQDVIEEYSGLGTILSQKVSVLDVTKAVEEQAREIARLKAEIERLTPGPQRSALEARLDYLTKRKAATVRRAQLARISLELRTKRHAAAATGRFDRTLDDAGGVLVREAEILLFALIVGGPLLLLGGALIAASRMRDRRLFERS